VRQRWLWAFVITLGWLAVDLITKAWALRALAGGVRGELLGGLVPLTLAFNRGAAFGLKIGSDPRWLFVPITLVALVFLVGLIRTAPEGSVIRVLAASMVLGGALGNLYDRVRWGQGVVDFLGPVDLGFTLFPIFNVADIGITCGAILLGIDFWREDLRLKREERQLEAPTSGGM
jgi:signal peptidase II